MANGITSGLTDLLGIDTHAGDAQMQQALAALQAVGVPNAAQLTLPELQKYMVAGVLTPQQYQSISENPDAFKEAFQGARDTTGSDTQKSSIQALNDIINSGGDSAISDAYLRDALNQTNQASKAQRGAIMSNAQERNASGNGLEFVNQLLGEQDQAQNLNNAAVQAGSNNAQLALQALTQKGQLGGQLQGQSDQNAQAQAQAAAQIAQYNSQLQSSANQYNAQTANQAQAANLANAQDLSNQNVTNANDRTKYNTQIPQTLFQDQLQKAQGIAGTYKDQASLQQQQEQMGAGLTGGLLGAAANVYSGSMAKPPTAPQYGGANGPNPKYNTNQYAPQGYASGGQVMAQPQPTGLRPGGDVQRGQPAPQGGGSHNSGIPKEALMALAGVMAAYPILKYSFGGGAPAQTTLNQDMGSQMPPADDNPMNMAHGGMCYAQGGETHDHRLCMEAGGSVPGDDSGMPMGHDDESQDVIPANLSPNEIVLPRSVAQSPNAPQAAAQFVGNIKGQDAGMQGGGGSFADVLAQLEANGIELRLTAKGS